MGEKIASATLFLASSTTFSSSNSEPAVCGRRTTRKFREMPYCSRHIFSQSSRSLGGTSVHYVSPTDDNQKQTQGMKTLGIYDAVNTEIGHIIVAEVNVDHVKELLSPDQVELKKLISKSN